jgi:ubiquinone/menaquinone biosynthesis C-methylase UbiE
MPNKKPYEKFAEVYDSIMRDKFYKDYYAFINRILRKLKFKPKSILEVACGIGRLMEIFHKKSYQIEGLDLSKGMLRIAKKKGLKVYQGNMINFNLKKKYDLILNIFDSLNYLQKSSDLEKCFKTTNRHINQNGLFIFDMNSDFKINKIIPTFKTEYYKVGDTELIWLNKYKPNTFIAEMIMFSKSNGKYTRFYEKHIERAYKLNKVKQLLKKANFKLISICSDFNFGKVKKNSKRWFFVTRKL